MKLLGREENDANLPRLITCLRRRAETTAEQTVWTGLKIETSTGPFLPTPHV